MLTVPSSVPGMEQLLSKYLVMVIDGISDIEGLDACPALLLSLSPEAVTHGVDTTKLDTMGIPPALKMSTEAWMEVGGEQAVWGNGVCLLIL